MDGAAVLSHGADDGATPASAGAPQTAEGERLRAQARLAGLQQEFQGVAGTIFSSDLFDTGFDKKRHPIEAVAEAEAREGSIPQEKWIDLLEPNNPEDDVYVT